MILSWNRSIVFQNPLAQYKNEGRHRDSRRVFFLHLFQVTVLQQRRPQCKPPTFGHVRKDMHSDPILQNSKIHAWNAKCPTFLGNFTPKASNYCLKNRALGFPGVQKIWAQPPFLLKTVVQTNIFKQHISQYPIPPGKPPRDHVKQFERNKHTLDKWWWNSGGWLVILMLYSVIYSFPKATQSQSDQ